MGYSYGYGFGHTWKRKKRAGAVAPPAVGGAGLLVGEANGFATDFTYATDASRVAVKASNVVTNYAVNSFYTNAGTSPKMVYDSAGVLGWSPHNYAFQSQAFDNATYWIVENGTVTANVIAAPDGTLTADKFVENSVNGPHDLQEGGLPATTGQVSVYAKAAGRTRIMFYDNVASLACGFDLTTGATFTVSGIGPVAGSTQDAGNGWWRCAMSCAAMTSVMIYTCNGTAYTYAGDGVSGVYLWGAQVNRGSVPTAYLPTTTAARIGLALDYDPVAPHNACLQSQTFDNASWSKSESSITANATAAPDGTTTADAYIPIAGPSSALINQGISSSITSGATHTTSVYAKNGTLGTAWIELAIVSTGVWRTWFNLTTGVKGTSSGTPVSWNITTLSGGWYRLDMTFVAGSAAATLYISPRPADGDLGSITGNGTSPAFYLWGAQMNLGTVPTVYVPTTTTASTGPLVARGLLCEPQATNLLLASSGFDATWGASGSSSITANAATAPDGTATADKMYESAGNTFFARAQNIAATTGIFSVYAKTAGRHIMLYDGTNSKGYGFNLSTGTTFVASGIPTTPATIQDVGNGWYRCSIVITSAASLNFYLHNGSNHVYQGNGTSGVYLWGAQAETGTVATSYIPTLGATVTRAADNVTCTAASIGYSATVGSWWVDTEMLGSNDAKIIIGRGNSAAAFPLYIQTATQFALFDSTILAKIVANTQGFHKFATAFQASDRAITADGLAVATDTGVVATLLSSTTVSLGVANANSNINGYIRKVRYLPRRPSNAEMQTMTT